MKPSELKSLVKARFTNNIPRSIYITGSPGVGKTQIVEQVAKELEVGFKVIHAPLLQPEDYGFPVITADRKDVNFVVSKDKFPLVGTDCPERGILLVDELPQADNSAQKILANLFQAREIHGQRLKPGWLTVATGNRTTDRAGANRLLSHLGARCTQVPLDVSLDDWTNWAFEHGIKTEVIAFIRFCPDLLNSFDSQQEINPTPRAWCEGVSASLGLGLDAALELPTFTGDVGEGPAAQFMGFVKIYRNLPSPDAIVLSPDKHVVPTDPATLYALCGALSNRATGDNFARIMTYVGRMAPEFTVLFVKDTMRRTPAIQTTPEFIKWASTDGARLLS
jgi:hypothetical protein